MEARTEDRWHRPARKGEQPSWPADEPTSSAAGKWCTDTKHGTPGSLVCTARHGTGQRWQARWVDHDGQERSKSFARKSDSQAHIAAITTQLGTGTYADPQRSSVTFGTVADAWLKTKEATNRAPKTVEGYRGLLDVVILPKWENHALRDIDHERLQQWFTWLSTNPAARKNAKRDEDGEVIPTGLSPARVIQIHQVMHQVFVYAIRCKYLAVNPADNIQKPSKPQSKDLALTHEQVRTLAGAIVKAEDAVRHRSDTAPAKTSPAGLAAMVRLMAYGGLRFGECAALRVGDVDVDSRRIVVDKQITQVRGRGRIEGDTKTHQVRRVPILTAELADALAPVIKGRDPDEYLFPGPDGNAMTIGWFNARFSKAVEALGVPGVTPHTLRHTAGSLVISEVGSVVVASKLLGHRNVSTTANVYSHMLDGDWDKLAAAMDKATT
ncbi:site-specific integrase [Mycolicibacterium sp. CH28]|uniref:tyrosine-type recombinase/integrase n=1 Tax=Mycolicibacterium sp. CH28 TaxID=2512237 RepID=UPI00108062F7|nr:site-specific integrase [Mycolicibacterium sp. CH28]TGD88558.1 site-specific integrase [Mycolicibacterium sp. CH28]